MLQLLLLVLSDDDNCGYDYLVLLVLLLLPLCYSIYPNPGCKVCGHWGTRGEL